MAIKAGELENFRALSERKPLELDTMTLACVANRLGATES